MRVEVASSLQQSSLVRAGLEEIIANEGVEEESGFSAIDEMKQRKNQKVGLNCGYGGERRKIRGERE